MAWPRGDVGDNRGVQGYRDDGVVLRTQKLGEADRIITLLTRQNGRVRAVAKGVRRTKSRFGGRLEPFTDQALERAVAQASQRVDLNVSEHEIVLHGTCRDCDR